jgi:uncharacterized protein YndB with AHSA1/START domain
LDKRQVGNEDRHRREEVLMSSSQLRFTTQIAGPTETIFDLVADMPNYRRWLPDSDVFGGTVDVTPYPVRLGTTYLDAGPVEKPGTVTEFDPPRHIGFHHTILVRRAPLNTDIDARIRYTFAPNEGGTFVLRELADPRASQSIRRKAPRQWPRQLGSRARIIPTVPPRLRHLTLSAKRSAAHQGALPSAHGNATNWRVSPFIVTLLIVFVICATHGRRLPNATSA